MASLHRTDLFVSPLWSCVLAPVRSHHEALLRHIRALRERDPQGRAVSNDGGWQSGDALHRDAALQPLVAALLGVAGEVAEAYGTTTRPVVESGWANVNPPGAFNVEHVHGSSVWSAVYYVQAPPDCGGIRFGDPRPGAAMLGAPRVGACPLTCDRVVVPAIEGMLLVFPSFLPHGVERNCGAAERVSLAFNLGCPDDAPD